MDLEENKEKIGPPRGFFLRDEGIDVFIIMVQTI